MRKEARKQQLGESRERVWKSVEKCRKCESRRRFCNLCATRCQNTLPATKTTKWKQQQQQKPHMMRKRKSNGKKLQKNENEKPKKNS